jgi:hypothetical protein
MFPNNFKPDDAYDLIRIGSDNDGGYLVDPNSIEQSNALLALGIGKNWSFEKDFLEHKNLNVHAYDYSVGNLFWIKHFIKRLMAVLIGRFYAPFHAVRTFLEFKEFFKIKAKLYLEKIGTDLDCDTSLNQALQRLRETPLFLKVDIEGYEYQILDEIIACQNNLSGLVIEFHQISKNKERIREFIDSIDLKLIHIHPNNNRLDEEGDPQAIELSFSKNPSKTGGEFLGPHSLDQDNVPRKKTVKLRFSEI